jgi:hypothetical protein
VEEFMAAIVRNARFVGAGTLFATATGGFAYWVNGKAKDLPADHKGRLFSRMKETIDAFRQSKTMQDAYTAKQHVNLVASLSSKQFTTTSDQSQNEINVLKISYYAGYIPEALKRNPGTSPPIFRYDDNLAVMLSPLSGQKHKGFAFAGRSPHIHDPQARDSILGGKYIRCESELALVDPEGENFRKKYQKVDVIVTGAIDQGKCYRFKNDFLRDLAQIAASGRDPLDPKDPYSDTPVFHASKKGIEATGDLTNMPQQTKEAIQLTNFTVCNFYTLKKTRLSGESFKEVGAIVAGTEKEEVCDTLAVREIRNSIRMEKS